MLSALLNIILACFVCQVALADNPERFFCGADGYIDIKLKCDGAENCIDGSDESFVTCFNNTCDEDIYFKCDYGACVLDTLKCNGHPDCRDGSDENKFLCAKDDEYEQLLEELRGDCGANYAMKCERKCLKWSKTCDGKKDCANGYDESSELCGATLCVEDSFRCANGACIRSTEFCNRVLDCADGSDELPYLCNEKYPDATTNEIDTGPSDDDTTIAPVEEATSKPDMEKAKHSASWETYSCRLTTSNWTHIQEYFTGNAYRSGELVANGNVIEVICEAGYVHFGKSIVKCQDSTWEEGGFDCVRVCSRRAEVSDVRYETHCIHQDVLVDCQSSAPLLDTTQLTTCAKGYRDASQLLQLGQHTCNADGLWTTERENPECQPICGVKPKQYPHLNPWSVSIFERKSNEDQIYEYLCAGSIISSHFVITAAECFKDQLNNAQEYSYFSVVQGNHSISFRLDEDHGYVQSIHRLQPEEMDLSKKYFLLKLSEPFIFGAKVSPICLPSQQVEAKAESSGVFYKQQLGEARVQQTNDKYTLEHIVISLSTMYNINEDLPLIKSIIYNI